MQLKEIFGHQYNIEHLDAKPIYIEVPAKAFSLPFVPEIPQYAYTGAYFEDGQLDWMTRQDDIQRIGESLVALERASPGYFHDLHVEWKKRFDEMLHWYHQEFARDLTSLTDTELTALMEALMPAYLQKLGFPPFHDAFMFYADKKLQESLVAFRETHQTTENASLLFSLLSAPVDDSFLSEEQNDLIAIANRQVKGEDVAAAIKEHQVKYSYLNTGYTGYAEYTIELIQQKIAELIAGQRLEPQTASLRNKEAKDELLKRHDFDEDIIRLAKMTEIFTKWQDERKAVTLTYVALETRYVQEVARRKNLSYDLLVQASHSELLDALQGKADLNELSRRQDEPYLRVYQGGEIALSVTGDEAKDFKAQSVQASTGTVKETRGFAASIGRAIGPVRVVRTFEDGKALQTGDVLVIPMTRPEHVPFMKKSAAIVTDDGGITCHAAIVARELGKPCIIGTKVATKVFQDGDMVEVDADHGVVRKINN